MTDYNIDEMEFDKTLDEAIFEDAIECKNSIQGLLPYTLNRYNIKLAENPETKKKILVHVFDTNYYIINTKEIKNEYGLQLFGHKLISKTNPEIYICDSVSDAMILNQELGLDAVAVFKDTDEILNSYNLLHDKDIYFISSTKSFENIKEKTNIPKARHLKFDTSITEHFKLNKNVDLINEYLQGGKSPNGIITADLDAVLKTSMISERSSGYSSGIRNLDRLTQGFSCDMVGIGAGTGCGKTTFMMQLAATLIKQDVKCGLMFFEQADEIETLNNLAGHFDNINYNYYFGTKNSQVEFDYEFEELPNQEVKTEEEEIISDDDKECLIEHYLKPTVSKIKDKVDIMTNDNETPSVEDALRMVRSLVIQKGCKAIFLDHTTYLTDGVENQNTAAQQLMQGLMQIKNRHRVNIFYVTHLRKSKTTGTHEEGARITLDDFAGGKASTQYATVTIGLERDMHNEDAEIAEITKMRLLKRRGMSVRPGDSVTEMKFDLKTNKLYPANCQQPKQGWDGVNF